MALLEMKHISKSFSGVYANEDISLSVDKGEILALLGENGAGKTTLMNILYGLYQADSGEILWKGKKVRFRSPREAIAAGIGMVQQHFSLVRGMTVIDNIILNQSTNSFFLDRASSRGKLLELSDRYGLPVDPDVKVADMSVGERQRAEILKALYHRVELLILDEPTGVLTPQETEHFFDVLRKLKEEGYGIIIITHRMSEIMAVSDRVTILRDGRKTADLATSKTSPDELSHYMIGRSPGEKRQTEETGKPFGEPSGEVMLQIKSLSRRQGKHSHKLDSIDLSVRKGEILGIAGVEGNGQKELAEVLAGIRKQTSGEIFLDGREISGDSIRSRYEEGISYISDDRQNDSLITGMNITENLMLREYAMRPYSKRGVINRPLWRGNAREKMRQYQIKASGTSGEATKVSLMSGGNQQKLIIAREVTDHARLVIASQPTRGLDIGAAEFVHGQLRKVRGSGRSVLLISADLEEILSLSDRIVVLYAGRIAGILDRSEADVQKIGLLMGGITGKERA